MAKPMATPLDGMTVKQIEDLAKHWAETADALAHQAAADSRKLLDLINPTRILAGAPMGSGKASAALASTTRDLRRALQTWNYLSKYLKTKAKEPK